MVIISYKHIDKRSINDIAYRSPYYHNYLYISPPRSVIVLYYNTIFKNILSVLLYINTLNNYKN